MKRRFNYTGRTRIKHESITITLLRDSHASIESFKAVIDFKGLKLPEAARIFVDAYHGTEQRRYDFGTVGKMTPPDDMSLSDLAYTEDLKFRILVVDGDGKIIAAADKVKPTDEAKEPLLPVDFVDLGKKVWRIEYNDEEGAPILKLNKNIPEIKNISLTPKFFFHIYPAVLREILTHIIFVDKLENQEEPDTEWHGKWLTFAILISGVDPPNLCADDEENFDEGEAEKWIEDVVTEFCNSKSNWYEFTQSIERMVNANDQT